MPLKSQKILTSKEEIKTFCGNISDYTFKKYIRMGMPARLEEGGSWWAHTDNIEEWFRRYTLVSMRNASEEI